MKVTCINIPARKNGWGGIIPSKYHFQLDLDNDNEAQKKDTIVEMINSGKYLLRAYLISISSPEKIYPGVIIEGCDYSLLDCLVGVLNDMDLDGNALYEAAGVESYRISKPC